MGYIGLLARDTVAQRMILRFVFFEEIFGHIFCVYLSFGVCLHILCIFVVFCAFLCFSVFYCCFEYIWVVLGVIGVVYEKYGCQ